MRRVVFLRVFFVQGMDTVNAFAFENNNGRTKISGAGIIDIDAELFFPRLKKNHDRAHRCHSLIVCEFLAKASATISDRIFSNGVLSRWWITVTDNNN